MVENGRFGTVSSAQCAESPIFFPLKNRVKSLFWRFCGVFLDFRFAFQFWHDIRITIQTVTNGAFRLRRRQAQFFQSPFLKNFAKRKFIMSRFINSLKRFGSEEDAPTMVEYGLLVVVIALVVVVAATTLGTGITGWFTTASNYGS